MLIHKPPTRAALTYASDPSECAHSMFKAKYDILGTISDLDWRVLTLAARAKSPNVVGPVNMDRRPRPRRHRCYVCRQLFDPEGVKGKSEHQPNLNLANIIASHLREHVAVIDEGDRNIVRRAIIARSICSYTTQKPEGPPARRSIECCPGADFS